ncbi:uncharacterized protein LOC134855125 isoform X2 [Symsagittifera roscoffensis]|uniref:uncharacterized protein LOC134855125 isoform X2 n=1 Tax=Symsagittifera roscoffensis TaxID=84072 RepID=UPI00307C1E4D
MQLFLVISLYLINYALSHSSCTARNDASSDVSFNHYGMCVFQDNLQGAVFLREGSSGLEYRVQVKGLSHGYHGFHVHTYGSVYRADVGEGRCVASGGHYDPLSATHGNINDTNRHVGDLGNICANEDGEAVDVFVDSDSSLTGTNPIRGRAIVMTSPLSRVVTPEVELAVASLANHSHGFRVKYPSDTRIVQFPLSGPRLLRWQWLEYF